MPTSPVGLVGKGSERGNWRGRAPGSGEMTGGPPPQGCPPKRKERTGAGDAEQIGERHLVPQLAPPERASCFPSRLQQAPTVLFQAAAIPGSSILSCANRTTPELSPLITRLGDGPRSAANLAAIRAAEAQGSEISRAISNQRSTGRGAMKHPRNTAMRAIQASRKASAGRRCAACNAGHTVASKHAATAKQPVSANSVMRSCTGRREMK